MKRFPYGVRDVVIRPFIGIWLDPRKFRWQWALFYEYADNTTGFWEPQIMEFQTRQAARDFRAAMGEATCFRNWSLKRRRVQRNWDHVRNLKGWTDKDSL